MDLEIPTYEHCEEHVKAGTACALEKFIYENEPAGMSDEVEFRAGLIAVLKEARADFETEACECWRCIEAAKGAHSASPDSWKP